MHLTLRKVLSLKPSQKTSKLQCLRIFCGAKHSYLLAGLAEALTALPDSITSIVLMITVAKGRYSISQAIKIFARISVEMIKKETCFHFGILYTNAPGHTELLRAKQIIM